MFIKIWRHVIACSYMYFVTCSISNCLRLDDEYHIKITDFGLCRSVNDEGVYVRQAKRRHIPVRTMPIDSYEEYTFKSDVVRVCECTHTHTNYSGNMVCACGRY
jgi:hypothetical protein